MSLDLGKFNQPMLSIGCCMAQHLLMSVPEPTLQPLETLSYIYFLTIGFRFSPVDFASKQTRNIPKSMT